MKKLNLISTTILAGILLLQLSTHCFHSHGAAGDVDLSFDAGSGINGNVSSAVLQPDGKIIIGGGFSMVKGLIRPGIARLNADGSGDSSFVYAGPNSGIVDVGPIVLQPDGKVLLGYASGIRRLNSDGTIDETFILPQTVDIDGFNVPINCIAVQPDGKIFIAGGFTFINNTNIQGLARLNSDGSLDTSFATGFGLPAFSFIYSMSLQSDGKLVIGGRFPGFHVTLRPNLVRLNANGSVDETFVTGFSENGEVDTLVLQPDGKVLVGGAFNTVDGTNRNGVVRLNANGSLDDSFNPTLDGGSSVSLMAMQSNGRVLIGGSFLTVDGIPRHHFARLNENGSLDASFDAGGNFDPGGGLAVQPDGKLIIASANKDFLIRLTADGGRDNSFTAFGGLGGGVRSLAIQPDGKVVIGGFFNFINGIATRGIARLHPSGTQDTNFIVDAAADGIFQIVALQLDGKLVIGGYSTFLNGINTLHGGIARLNPDGSLDSSFDPGTGVDGGQVDAITFQPDGKILIAGGFETVNGIARQGVARLNTNGTVDTSFNLNMLSGGSVQAVAVQSDGQILIGGGLMQFAGDEKQYALVRVNADGTRDGSFDFDRIGTVTSIVIQPNGKVLVAGRFSTPENESFPDWIARLNSDGSIDNTFQPDFAFRSETFDDAGIVSAGSLVLQPDFKVLVAGDYFLGKDDEENDNYFRGIYRLNSNGSLDTSFSPGGGAIQAVSAIGLQADGKVIAGGDFSYVMRPYIARLYGDSFGPLPLLNIARSNEFVVVSWPTSAAGFQLQASTNFSLLNSWSGVEQPTVTNAGKISVTVPVTTRNTFFRLEN